MTRKDPWEDPAWHAIGREGHLVRHLIGSGATALGRANYADKFGEYYTAFFGLSIGLERLAKLILVADYAISNGGKMPEENVVRKFGHKITQLIAAVSVAAQKYSLDLRYNQPSDAISTKIIECLDAFADAGRGRYANFASLGMPNLSPEEPIRKWWGEVAELVLRTHYFGKPAQARIEGRAKVIDALMSPVTMVRFTNETGDMMTDVYTSSARTGQAELVQRYGRYYVLTVARWLSEVLSELSREASGNHNIDGFYGLWELFWTYTVDDEFLKTRKIWPLT